MIFLEGIKIGGYRSFREPISLPNLSKINIIIGQNNSGKSNVLRFIVKHLRNIASSSQGHSFSARLDRPYNLEDQKLTCEIQIKRSGVTLQRLTRSKDLQPLGLAPLFRALDEIWFPYISPEYGAMVVDNAKLLRIAENVNINHDEWYALYQTLFHRHGNNIQRWVTDVLELLNPGDVLPKNISLIPATRSLRAHHKDATSIDGDGFHLLNGIREHGGIGLIEELFKIERPDMGQEHQKERFDKINDFIRDVTGSPNLILDVPHTKKTIRVTMDGKKLDIEDLGKGIEQLIIIATTSTLFSKQIVCIEEPELYLHPTLQRKLLTYLEAETDNQYFIATHSAHLINSVPSSLYHIQLKDGYSQVISEMTDATKFSACADLGYRASDLLQSNSVIWVEGPSDRIYLNHWIKAMDSTLQEGLHYSIMFYGGRLLVICRLVKRLFRTSSSYKS